MADLISVCNTFMNSSILFLAALSSAKFVSQASLIKKNKIFIRILNKMRPNIEPCGILDKSI